MEDGKGARKSDDITATPIREAQTTSKKQQSERKQEPPKKPRSAMKKDLTAYFGEGKRSPGPTTAGNPIEINKLLNKLSQILICTIWTDKGLFDCRVCAQQGHGGATGKTTHWSFPLVTVQEDSGLDLLRSLKFISSRNWL